MHPDSVWPGYNPSLGMSLVTVVTGHKGYHMLEEEVGWKLIGLYLHAVCYNTHFHRSKTLGHAEKM